MLFDLSFSHCGAFLGVLPTDGDLKRRINGHFGVPLIKWVFSLVRAGCVARGGEIGLAWVDCAGFVGLLEYSM